MGVAAYPQIAQAQHMFSGGLCSCAPTQQPTVSMVLAIREQSLPAWPWLLERVGSGAAHLLAACCDAVEDWRREVVEGRVRIRGEAAAVVHRAGIDPARQAVLTGSSSSRLSGSGLRAAGHSRVCQPHGLQLYQAGKRAQLRGRGARPDLRLGEPAGHDHQEKHLRHGPRPHERSARTDGSRRLRTCIAEMA